MEPTPNSQLPDRASKHRVLEAGALGVGALSAMGMYSATQIASAEKQPVATQHVISAEDLHGSRSEVASEAKPNLEKSAEVESQTAEPAVWWPTEVKQNWLLIQSTAREYDIDPYLVATIITEESAGKNVNNPSGATGLMQIMPATAQDIARQRHRANYNMTDPQQNLDFGCWLIHYLDGKYIAPSGANLNSDLGIAMLAVYYGDGEGAGELWAKNGYNPKYLSTQAQQVTTLWQNMYRDRQGSKSDVFASKRMHA
jgi:hypothetical protein